MRGNASTIASEQQREQQEAAEEAEAIRGLVARLPFDHRGAVHTAALYCLRGLRRDGPTHRQVFIDCATGEYAVREVDSQGRAIETVVGDWPFDRVCPRRSSKGSPLRLAVNNDGGLR